MSAPRTLKVPFTSLARKGVPGTAVLFIKAACQVPPMAARACTALTAAREWLDRTVVPGWPGHMGVRAWLVPTAVLE